MYPTIYHFFYDVFGLEGPAWEWMKIINSFGFFVAMAFIAAHYLLVLEVKRKEGLGLFFSSKSQVEVGHPPKITDILVSAGLGFVLGYKFVFMLLNSSEVFSGPLKPQEYLLSLQGNWYAGILLAALFGWMRWREAKKEQLEKPEMRTLITRPHEHIGNITIVAAITGVLGAKLFHLFENPRQFVEFFTNPSLDSFLSGLTIYGGLIIGGSLTYFYTKRLGFKMIHFMDSAAPALIAAYGIGRIGCQVSGDGDWGIVNLSPKPTWLNWLPDWVWSYNYPNNVNGVGSLISDGPCFEGYCTELIPSVFPTPFYETMMALVIFAILWYLRKKWKAPGALFALYLVFNGIERFLIESIRVNVKMNFLGMEVTQAQVISTIFFITGISLLYYFNKRHKSKVKTI